MLRLLRNEAWATARCAFYRFERHAVQGFPTADTTQATLIVHGLFGRPEMFYPMANYLQRNGFGPIFFVTYPSTTATIDDIIQCIQDGLGRHTPTHWNIIGHSLGAIATRAALKQKRVDQPIRRFIALGAPFLGTRWYGLAPSALRDPFDPNGEWCKRINTMPEPSTLRVVRALHDQNVRPSKNASLPGVPETVIEHVGHNGLINHPDVFKAVMRHLQ